MQHIALNLINEKGELVQKSEINFADILLFLFRQENFENRFPWLSTIDPYGLTIFNQLQIKNITKELEMLQIISENKLKSLIQESSNFIKRSGDLEFIKFIGD